MSRRNQIPTEAEPVVVPPPTEDQKRKAAEKGWLLWECPDCQKRWRGHSRIKRCPDCGSANIAASTLGGGDERIAAEALPYDPPGLTSTTTPAGIARHDPDAQKADVPAERSRDLTRLPVVVMAPLARIVPSPTNPRKHFDEQALQSLAESLKKVGLLEPILVRHVTIPAAPDSSGESDLIKLGLLKARPGEQRYELIAGERRWRAAKLAKLQAIPARVLDVTDEEALEIQARENVDRDDLDPIERALMFQQLMEKCGWTQQVLGKRFGLEQGTVANCLRLLKLPAEWQSKVISGEISPRHAREVLSWSDVPGLVEKLDDRVREAGGIGSLAEFRTDVLQAVEDCSRSIDPDRYEQKRCLFRPTKAQLAELDVREVPSPWGSKKTKRAFNLAKWDELQAAAKKRQREEAKKNPKPKQRPWEQQWKRDRFLRAMRNAKARALGAAIAARLDPAKHEDLVLRLYLLLILCGALRDAGEELLGVGFHHGRQEKDLGAIVRLPAKRIEALPVELLKRALAEPLPLTAYGLPIPLCVLDWAAQKLKIDLADVFVPDAEFFEAWGDRLPELIAQLPGDAGPELDAAGLVEAWPAGFVPREVRDVTADGKLPGKAKKGKEAR